MISLPVPMELFKPMIYSPDDCFYYSGIISITLSNYGEYSYDAVYNDIYIHSNILVNKSQVTIKGIGQTIKLLYIYSNVCYANIFTGKYCKGNKTTAKPKIYITDSKMDISELVKKYENVYMVEYNCYYLDDDDDPFGFEYNDEIETTFEIVFDIQKSGYKYKEYYLLSGYVCFN